MRDNINDYGEIIVEWAEEENQYNARLDHPDVLFFGEGNTPEEAIQGVKDEWYNCTTNLYIRKLEREMI